MPLAGSSQTKDRILSNEPKIPAFQLRINCICHEERNIWDMQEDMDTDKRRAVLNYLENISFS